MTINTIKTVAYDTTDGKRFADLREALQHQRLLDIEADLANFLAERGAEGRSAAMVRNVVKQWELFRHAHEPQSDETDAL